MSKHSFLKSLLSEMEKYETSSNQTLNQNNSIECSEINQTIQTIQSSQSYPPLSMNDTKQVSNMLDNVLFLGSQFSTKVGTINKLNIKVIISIGCNPLTENDSSITYYKYDVEDNGGYDNVNYFFTQLIPEIHLVINHCIQTNTPVLVHCQAGISRSATVIITWFMKYKNMSYLDAFNYVKSRRSVITPNLTFREWMEHKM